MLPTEAMLISMVLAPAEGHVLINGSTATGGCVDDHGLCYLRKPCGRPSCVLLLKDMLMSEGCAARVHVLPPRVMMMSVAHAVVQGHVDGHRMY